MAKKLPEGTDHIGSYRNTRFSDLHKMLKALQETKKEGKQAHDADVHVRLIKAELSQRAWSVVYVKEGKDVELERFRGCTLAYNHTYHLGNSAAIGKEKYPVAIRFIREKDRQS